MNPLRAAWRLVAGKHGRVAGQAVAELDEQRAAASAQLEQQREGLRREKRNRRAMQAELDRMILAATLAVLRKKAGEQER